MKFTFNIKYFIVAVVLFVIEALIAAFVHDQFVRPIVGDFLVVILLYAILKSFVSVKPTPAAIAVLIFAYFIEVTQYFHLINHLGLEHSTPARLILGNTFQWEDIIAYTLGVAVIILVEVRRTRKFLP